MFQHCTKLGVLRIGNEKLLKNLPDHYYFPGVKVYLNEKITKNSIFINQNQSSGNNL